MKINLKLLLLFLEITLIPLTILGFVAYSSSKSELTSQITSKLQAVAEIQKNRLEDTNKNNQVQIALLAGDINLLQETDMYLKSLDRALLKKIQNILFEEIKVISDFRAVSVADLKGNIVASTNANFVGLNIADTNYFRTAKNTLDVTDFSKDQNGVVSLIFAAPLIKQGKTIAVLVVNTDGSDINSIVSSYSGLGETGETLLATKNANNDALFLTPTRWNPRAALTQIVSKDRSNVAVTHAVNGEESVLLNAVDYHNIPVIAVTRYLPEAKWGIVAKVSQAEAYAPVEKLRNLLVFMGLISTLAVVFISFSVAKSFTDPIVKITKIAKEVADGDLSKRIADSSRNEIGLLAKVFNEMTAKLQILYQDLEQQVRDRTRQLSEKVRELETANNIIDREKVKDEAMLASIGEGLIAVDNEGKIMRINKVAEEMLGLTETEIVTKPLFSVVPVTDEKGELLPEKERPVIIALATGRTTTTTTTTGSRLYYTRKDGSKFPAAITVTPVLLGGKIIGAIDLFHDVTSEKAIDRAKTEFVSLASHQLRTPLSIVNWYTEILLSKDSGPITAKQKDCLDEIYTASKRMVELVNSLLNVSRLELGTFAAEPVPTDISALITEVITEMQPLLEQKQIKLKTQLATGLPLIPVDTKLLRMIWQNLLSNSLKYTPKSGTIKVSLQRVKKDEPIGGKFCPGDGLVFIISDTGVGIPDSQKNQIFNKFFRADNIRDIDPDGTGLGLYIVKSIMEYSEGQVWFDSRENNGTSFFIFLPIQGMKQKTGSKSLS